MVKLLIGVLTHGKHRYCLDEFTECLTAQRVKADVLFVVNHGESAYCTLLRSRNLTALEDPVPASTRIEKIVNGRNFIRDYALKNGYDSLLFVDSDVMLPKNAIVFLYGSKSDVVSGVYLNNFNIDGKDVIAPVLFKDLGQGNCKLYTYDAVASSGEIVDIGAAGLGCCLISRKVLESVSFRSFNSSTGGEDMAFFVDARAKGFKTVANLAVKCVHRPFPKEDARAALFEWNRHVSKGTVFTLDLNSVKDK